MASRIDLGDTDTGEDDGYVTVSMKILAKDGEPEQKIEVRLDLFEMSSRLNEYWKANSKKSAHEYNEGLCQIVQEAGLPKPSHAVAQQFQRHIDNLTKELLKKKDISPG